MLRKVMHILFYTSLLVFIETALEMYILTLFNGPQMLFFGLVHVGGAVLFGLLAISALAFILFFIVGAVLLALSANGKVSTEKFEIKLIKVILLVQSIHVSLLISYDTWAYALFSTGS